MQASKVVLGYAMQRDALTCFSQAIFTGLFVSTFSILAKQNCRDLSAPCIDICLKVSYRHFCQKKISLHCLNDNAITILVTVLTVTVAMQVLQ